MGNSNILIVEDQSIIAEDLQQKLANMGYGVSVASSGEEAIGKAMEEYYDLVLMDIKLTENGMDGIEAAQEIRTIFDIPVIYATAYADDKTLERAKITEPSGYILKPFNERELRATIEMAIYKHETERKLKTTERWLAMILKSMGDGVVALDCTGYVTLMNPAAEALTGWKQGDAMTEGPGEVIHFIDERTNIRVEDFLSLVPHKEVFTSLPDMITLIARDGTRRAIEGKVSLIKDDRNIPLGVVLVFRDITKRRETEEFVQQGLARLKSTLSGTVNVLAATGEMIGIYAEGHPKWVAQLASVIASEMGLSDDRVEGIRVAGLLHDIGKATVPKEVLSRPSALSEAEWVMVKDHPRAGYEIAKDAGFPWPVAETILQHHERADGSGYPQGLNNDQMTLEARILSVAETVTAIALDELYRPALEIDKAIEEIEKNKDTLYDRDVVEVCVRLFREKGFKFE